MKKRIWLIGAVMGAGLGLTACGGPSNDKIEEAQLKYTELVEVHNKTIEAHNEVDDYELDEELQELTGQVTAMQDYNLAELSEEDIDVIIEEMSSTIEKYEATIVLLTEKQQEEEDAALIEVPLTLHNRTGKEWNELYLHAQGEEQGDNILDATVTMGIGETLTGIYLYRTNEEAPLWLMELSDAEGLTWELEIATADLDENGTAFYLKYDSENDTLILDDADEIIPETLPEEENSENAIDNSDEEL